MRRAGWHKLNFKQVGVISDREEVNTLPLMQYRTCWPTSSPMNAGMAKARQGRGDLASSSTSKTSRSAYISCKLELRKSQPVMLRLSIPTAILALFR